MSKLMAQVKSLTYRIPGRAYLLFAILIFASANSITRKLTELGAQNLIDGRNPISFCNVLFVGNLCALITLSLIYGKQLHVQSFKQLSWSDWLGLSTVAILSGALAPALFFMALDLTMVNNVVLIGRIEPPLILALSILLLRERVNYWVIAGAIASFIGVVLTIVLQTPEAGMMTMGGFQIGTGELMAAGAAVSLAFSTIISKIKLRQIPLGFFSLFRMALGTVVFFTVALKLYGIVHFADVFSPFLWQWMAIYSVVIIVGGQLCWFTGLKTTNASDVSLASAFSPLAGILAAYMILGKSPTMAQYIGGSVIICGIILNQIGVARMPSKVPTAPQASSDKEQDMEVGFKGI